MPIDSPRIEHLSDEAALSEATRLSAQQPGDTFVVLQAIHIVRTELRPSVRYQTLRAPTPR
jgi:hypothetical protein